METLGGTVTTDRFTHCKKTPEGQRKEGNWEKREGAETDRDPT